MRPRYVQIGADKPASLLVWLSRRIRWLALATLIFLLVWELVVLLTPSNISLDQYLATSTAVNPGWIAFSSDNTSAYSPTLGLYKAPATFQERAFTFSCLEEWIAQGTLCSDLSCADNSCPLPQNYTLDALWTWTNGSSPFVKAARNAHLSSYASQYLQRSGAAAARHFRTSDELRYSIRSVTTAFRGTAVRCLHIFSSDLPSNTTNIRYGAIPEWLDLNKKRIRMHFPWTTFATSNETLARDMLSTVLPTFQSHSIEAAFPFLQGIADSWIYLCDDYFITRPLAVSDVATPLFGPTFRIQRDYLCASQPKGHFTASRLRTMDGEAPSLAYTNWLLDQRFGELARPYPVHTIKVFDKNILAEIKDVWPEELAETASNKFRGSGTDTNMAFLFTKFVIERHREVLLWSYVVARIDEDQDGIIDKDEIARAIQDLLSDEHNIRQKNEAYIRVHQPYRPKTSLDVLQQAGFDLPRETNYTLPSSDGFGYAAGRTTPWHGQSWPEYSSSDNRPLFCKLELSCLTIAEAGEPADMLFKRLTFDKRACGNCLITALLNRSGKQGLGAFLPAGSSEANTNFETPVTVAVLPKSKSWSETDFGLATVQQQISKESVKHFCLRLIQRYSYVIADTPFHFMSLSTPVTLERQLHTLETDRRALLVMNDDIILDEEAVNSRLQKWLQLAWPLKEEWEL